MKDEGGRMTTDMTDPTPPRRSFCPTPAWLIYGLLVVECLLWLSDRYRWFGFNEHKGWTVLIAVAAVGVAMLLILGWFIASLLFRWRFQFSIRSLLVLVVAVAVPCSWLGVEMKKAKEQRKALEESERLGGYLRYDYEATWLGFAILNPGPPGPVWLRTLLGNDFFAVAVLINLGFTHVTDAGMPNTKGFGHLQGLYLDQTQVTDITLEHIKELSELRGLGLEDTQITDAGLVHVEGLTQLQWLFLGRTHVGDAGLEHLQCLAQLQRLSLDGTQVTNAGVGKLQQLLPHCKIRR